MPISEDVKRSGPKAHSLVHLYTMARVSGASRGESARNEAYSRGWRSDGSRTVIRKRLHFRRCYIDMREASR